jgi:pimeloyl-ACP methyl ester carboxylesterase
MDHAEEVRLDRIIHVLKLVVSRKTAEKAAHEAAGGCEDGAGAGSLPKPQDPEPVSVALNLSSFSSARRTDPLARATTTAVPGRLSTRAELLQRIEADRGRPVLPRRLQLILAAFTRPAAAGDDEARNIDLPALLLYGFDDFLTDTASHRFSTGEAVVMSSRDKGSPTVVTIDYRGPVTVVGSG